MCLRVRARDPEGKPFEGHCHFQITARTVMLDEALELVGQSCRILFLSYLNKYDCEHRYEFWWKMSVVGNL